MKKVLWSLGIVSLLAVGFSVFAYNHATLAKSVMSPALSGKLVADDTAVQPTAGDDQSGLSGDDEGTVTPDESADTDAATADTDGTADTSVPGDTDDSMGTTDDTSSSGDMD